MEDSSKSNKSVGCCSSPEYWDDFFPSNCRMKFASPIRNNNSIALKRGTKRYKHGNLECRGFLGNKKKKIQTREPGVQGLPW